ncbi:MAG TPA: FHA domain-containing protein [Oligoflexia bacterium]|nr:FHA domain-containing protein [Oligoflexia bacterium]
MLNKNKKSSQRSSDFDQQPCLYVLNGFDTGKMIHIYQQSMSIGSTKTNDIVLRGQGVDDMHARLDIVDRKNITLSNYSNNYPTLINGQIINQTSIKASDQIQIGELKLELVFKTHNELSMYEFSIKKNMLDASGLLLKKDFLKQQLTKEIEYAKKIEQTVSCAMLSINVDSFDKDIKQYIQLIQKSSRSYDLLSHYKDNIFCLVLKNTALDNALVFAKRLSNNFLDNYGSKVQINMGISTSQNHQLTDADLMMANAFGYLQEACRRSKESIVSQRNI